MAAALLTINAAPETFQGPDVPRAYISEVHVTVTCTMKAPRPSTFRSLQNSKRFD